MAWTSHWRLSLSLAIVCLSTVEAFVPGAVVKSSNVMSLRSCRSALLSLPAASDDSSVDSAAAAPEPPAPASKSKQFKGFGEKPKKKEPPPKTQAQLEREKYAQAYDDLAAKGVPEYAVYIREASSTNDKDWKFVGSMAVPRNVKPDQAIYENEVNLVKGGFKMYPKLREKEAGGFTYGYNLKKFPDEPIKVAVKPAVSGEKNPVVQFLENLMDPLDASGIKGG